MEFYFRFMWNIYLNTEMIVVHFAVPILHSCYLILIKLSCLFSCVNVIFMGLLIAPSIQFWTYDFLDIYPNLNIDSLKDNSMPV